jgi:hypothetical protein
MLRGRVQEARLGVPGATVLVQTGIGAGQSALTTSGGDFTLYGIAGPVRLRVTRDGYVPATADVTVMAHDQAPVIDIVQTSIPALAGTYALNIRAGACQNAVTLPSEAHTRTYVATVQQNGPALEVVLSGAQFLYEPARFTGRVLPEKAMFTIYGPDDYYYYYSSRKSEVVERVSSSLIVVSGTLDSAVAAGRLAGQWNGLIRVVQGSDPRGPSRTDCYSSAHQFEFSR